MQRVSKNRCPDKRSAKFAATARSPPLRRLRCRRAMRKRRASPLRQLQLEPAIAAKGFFGAVGIERLKFAKSGGDKALRRYALADEILDHRYRPRRRQRPVRGELRCHD